MKLLVPMMAASVLVLSTAAMSANQTTPKAPTDGNGSLTAQQIAPMLYSRSTRFHLMDLNEDGYIVRDEINQSDPELLSQFASLDANNDGKLSADEYVLSHRTVIE